MQEDPLVRSIRRGLSQQLTKTINDSARYPEVRLAVLHSLSTLWGRLESFKDVLRKDLGLHPAQPLFYFYMKGGNAYECISNPAGAAATTLGGGDSDWDSQIVVDPWAPIPIQRAIYAALEDLIRDELRNCAVEIASWSPDIQTPDELLFQAPLLLYRYQAELDDPQTIRQVLDHNQTGLWIDTRRKMSDQVIKGRLPGTVYNDSIAPFQLFRLGYTWHAKPLDWPPPAIPGQAKGPEIARPLLMELIDVTLPRRNTVEAVELWEELFSGSMTISQTNVSYLYQGTTITEQLPLPSLAYHFNEQVLMLCEVAAGVSKSFDKVDRRFTRLNNIYNAAAGVPALQADYQAVMAAMAGISVAQLGVRPAAVGAVDAVLRNNGAARVLAAAPGTAEYMALNMMYQVASRQINYQGDECILARRLLNIIIARLSPQFAIAEAGASDDLALYSAIVRNGYFKTDNFAATGIAMSAYLRVRDSSRLEDAGKFLCDNLPRWLSDLAAAAAALAPTPLDVWVANHFFGKVIRVERREHVTFRQAGMSREQTLVVFVDERALACITLTSAIASEAPFIPDPLMSGVLMASVVDMAEQRKVAAAVIKDFCIRNALAKQLELLNRLFPSLWSQSL